MWSCASYNLSKKNTGFATENRFFAYVNGVTRARVVEAEFSAEHEPKWKEPILKMAKRIVLLLFLSGRFISVCIWENCR